MTWVVPVQVDLHDVKPVLSVSVQHCEEMSAGETDMTFQQARTDWKTTGQNAYYPPAYICALPTRPKNVWRFDTIEDCEMTILNRNTSEKRLRRDVSCLRFQLTCLIKQSAKIFSDAV